MKSFFKFTLASILGVIISAILLFFIFFGIVSAIVSSSQNKEINVKENSILFAKLNTPILERGSDNPFDNFNFSSFDPNPIMGLNDIVKNIKKAKDDDNIKGIYLELSVIPTSFATIEEIRNAMIDFKESGKFVVVFADFLTQGAYYLASIADKIYLNPEGVIDFKGLGAELMFFKGSLEKLGIEPQIFKVGKFKSAIEPLILDKMSDENRLQIEKFIGTLWDHAIQGVSEYRKISINDLNKFADELLISNADSALKYNFVDKLMYKDEVLSELKERLEIAEKKDINSVTLKKYTNSPQSKREHKGLAKNKIAIVYAQGDIVSGNGEANQIGAETISKALRSARRDSSIKAIVFRINSGGGSALASEIIWREVDMASKVKPVIASMSDVAASGGYYIACAADTIVAHENTITGSIGVFGVMFNGKEFLNKKLGVTTDRVKTNKHSDYQTFSRALDEYEKKVIQREVDNIYDVFLTRVSEGRNMPKEKVNEIGQGRVWSGVNAMEIGLIDVYGGMDKAIEIAKEMAGLDNYRIVELPKKKDPIEQIMSELTGDAKARIMKEELGESYPYYMNFKRTLSQEGVLTRMPFDLVIE